MRTEQQKIGQRGEKLAARYLRRDGYRILAKNKHFGRNELDIIARNKEHILFVEVKARTVMALEDCTMRPSEAVNREKRQRTVSAALDYLKENPTSLCPRFDVIEVYLSREKRPKLLKINHIVAAFRASGRLR